MADTSDQPVAVVTGANSGIGRATAIRLAEKGYRVFGTVREKARATKLLAMAADHGAEVELVELDVADDQSVADGFGQILSEAGRVDVLVNNAGVGGNATVEDCSTELMADVMNVNLYGGLRCLRAALPGMRERRSGAIVNITSVAGKFASPGQAPYVASKWAFEGLCEELANEVASYGIRVVIIEPGTTKSAIFAKNVELPNVTGAYDIVYRRMFQMYATGVPHAADPFVVADVIHEAITTDTPQLRYRMCWGSEEMITGRARMSDEDWVAMGAIEDDADFYKAFQDRFGLEITP